MRRVAMLLAIVAALALPARAQIGKHIPIRAGTPEDRLLNEINASTDPAKRLELLQRFIQEFAGSDVVLVGYEMLMAHYWGEKDYEKVFEYGEKALAIDADNFMTAVNLFRAAQEKGDAAKLFEWGGRIGTILKRYKARAAPEGTDPAEWEQKKAATLEEVAENVAYVGLTWFSTAYQMADPAARAAALERFLAAFPDSPYAENAQAVAATSYLQGQNPAKMVDFAQRILAASPENLTMLLLLADYWSENGQQLDQADAHARKALELLNKAQKPARLDDEQWQRQVALQKGLAHSILGQVHIHKNRNAQAVESFRAASLLLKPDAVNYARNLYRLGFTLAKMQRIAEAKTVLTEAVAIASPYRPLAQETLNKIGGPARPAKRP